MKAIITKKEVFTSKKGVELCAMHVVFENGEVEKLIVKPDIGELIKLSDFESLDSGTVYELVFNRRGYLQSVEEV